MGGLNVRFPFQKGVTFRFHLGCRELYTVSCHSSYCNYWPGQHRHQKHLKSGHSSHLLFKIWSQAIQKLNAEQKSWIQPYHVTILKTFHEGLCTFHVSILSQKHACHSLPSSLSSQVPWSNLNSAYDMLYRGMAVPCNTVDRKKNTRTIGKSCYKVGIRLSKCKGGGYILPRMIPLPPRMSI